MKRYLSTKEKAECLDFPNTRTTLMTEVYTNLLTKSEVPGKSLVASLWYLIHDARKSAEGQLALGKRIRIESCFGNNKGPKRRKCAGQAKANNETWVEEDDFELQSPLRESEEEVEEEDDHIDAIRQQRQITQKFLSTYGMTGLRRSSC